MLQLDHVEFILPSDSKSTKYGIFLFIIIKHVIHSAPAAAYMGAPRPLPGAPVQARPPIGAPNQWQKAPQPSPVYQQYNQR